MPDTEQSTAFREIRERSRELADELRQLVTLWREAVDGAGVHRDVFGLQADAAEALLSMLNSGGPVSAATLEAIQRRREELAQGPIQAPPDLAVEESPGTTPARRSRRPSGRSSHLAAATGWAPGAVLPDVELSAEHRDRLALAAGVDALSDAQAVGVAEALGMYLSHALGDATRPSGAEDRAEIEAAGLPSKAARVAELLEQAATLRAEMAADLRRVGPSARERLEDSWWLVGDHDGDRVALLAQWRDLPPDVRSLHLEDALGADLLDRPIAAARRVARAVDYRPKPGRPADENVATLVHLLAGAFQSITGEPLRRDSRERGPFHRFLEHAWDAAVEGVDARWLDRLRESPDDDEDVLRGRLRAYSPGTMTGHVRHEIERSGENSTGTDAGADTA